MSAGLRLAGLRRVDRLDGFLAIISGAFVVSSAAALVLAGLRPSFVAPGLDLFLDTTTMVVSAAVAGLAFLRYRNGAGSGAAFQAAAFLVSAIADGFALLPVLGQFDDLPGAAGLAPGQAPLYVSTFARLTTAALLVIGGAATLRRRDIGHPRTIVAAPVLALVGIIVASSALNAALPNLGGEFEVLNPAEAAIRPLSTPESTLFGGLAQLVGAALFLWATAQYRLLYRRDGRMGDAFLSLGLLFASFSQVHLAVFPGSFADLVTSGDLMVLAFDVALLFGIEAEVESTMADLRRTNQRLELLKTAEADRAALEERARLSRELHDGLAQDLWFAKLKAGRLSALPDLGPEATALSEELGAAIDAGLADARQAVMALRMGGASADAPFSELMRRYVDDFGDRFGVPAEFECSHDLPPLTPRAEAELLRIAQEALSNVHRHADATLVRVQVALDEGELAMTIRDNGRGFDPSEFGDSTFGLAGMRERAALIGGRFEIVSHPLDGACVTIRVPLANAAAPGLAIP